MGGKIHLTLVFGGKSAEHEVSIVTAKSVMTALNPSRYEVKAIAVGKDGSWSSVDSALLSESPERIAQTIRESKSDTDIMSLEQGVFSRGTQQRRVFFPLIHGTNGEDGTLQGLLEIAGTPYVGAGVLGSAVGMDKDVMKRLLRDAGLPVGQFRTLREGENISFADLESVFCVPFFVKPANAGSSVGVSKVRTGVEWKKAKQEALGFDTKILVEKMISGKEVEVAVLGNSEPEASVCGEVRFADDFYAYDTKYAKDSGTEIIIPADIPETLSHKIRKMACEAFRVLECSGMARVDFFVTSDERVFINEINTIPGFTPTSMYPKLWEASGLSYSHLIDRLVFLALERYNEKHF